MTKNTGALLFEYHIPSRNEARHRLLGRDVDGSPVCGIWATLASADARMVVDPLPHLWDLLAL